VCFILACFVKLRLEKSVVEKTRFPWRRVQKPSLCNVFYYQMWTANIKKKILCYLVLSQKWKSFCDRLMNPCSYVNVNFASPSRRVMPLIFCIIFSSVYLVQETWMIIKHSCNL